MADVIEMDRKHAQRIESFFMVVSRLEECGAGDGDRTRNFQLGKLTLYH